MSTDTKTPQLIINTLTKAQYDAAYTAGNINNNELYFVTDEKISYNDLDDKPTIPAAQVNSDWNASSGIAQILNKPSLATVATTGDYTDLTNKPTIPTVNNATLTIQKNGTTINTFTANASSNVTANIEVPTKTSDLTNDDGFITGISSTDVTTALGFTPYDANNPNGYTSNTGTVTSVNNTSPVNGNVTISIPTVDQSYSDISTNAQSGVAVKSAIDSAISSVYKPAGSVAYASLPTPASTNEGYVYNVTDTFTTDSRFIEGSGKTYPAGTNVVIIEQTGEQTSETLYAWTKSFKDTCYTKTYPPSQGDIIYDASGNVKSYSPVYSVINNGTSYSINVTLSGSSYGPYDRNTESDISGQQDTYKFDVLAGMVDLSRYVQTTRTVNGKALSSNITLTASDVSALPSSTVIPTITDTYSSTSSNGMSGKAVASAISSKQDSSTAVTHTASTAVGSATQPVYIASNGTATATTYELNKTVPADAVFTDTTYSAFSGANGSSAGSAGLVPAPTATDNTKYLKGNGTWSGLTFTYDPSTETLTIS